MSVKIFDKAQNKWVIFPGSIGAPGRSAYELAVQQGYKGTLDEWLKSIKGADGRDAYTIAVEGGYKGTEEEYNNALTIAPVAVDKINNADTTPTKDSTNLVLSGGVKDAIDSLNSDFNADLATINSSITNLSDEIDNIVNVEIGDQLKSSIIDNLTSSDTEKALSARQGKILKELIDNLANLQITVVDTLPTTGESNIIYLVKKAGTGTDIHDEYVYVEGNWEKIGTTDVDLTNYYTKTQVDSIKDTLDNKISNNTLSITNITTNGSITPESLKIQKNGVDLLDAWNGSKEGVANIVVPTSLSELNATKDDIVEILGYIPADSAQAGIGDVTGPVTAVDGNLVAFDKDGKHIKDSQYNVGSFAVKNHTHTVSQITDFPEIPDPITVDDTLSTTSTNPVQNKVVATALNNKVNNATLGSYVKTADLNVTLGNYYTTTEVYTKNEIDEKIGSAGGGDVMASGNLAVDYIIIGAGPKSIKNSGQTLSNLALKSEIPSLSGYATQSWVTGQGYSTENTWRPVKVGSTTLNDSSTTLTIANGTGIGLSFSNGTLTITNSAPGSSYTLPVAKNNVLGGIKTGYTESGGAEMAIYVLEDGTAYTLLKDTTVKTALGFTPANVNDIPEIPIALPNPYALNVTAGGSTTSYTGSSTSSVNLDNIYAKKLPSVDTPGKPGLYFASSGSVNVTEVYVTENNPDAIILVANTVDVTFGKNYHKMDGIDSLSGGNYKCYCITYVRGVVLVNGAIYG
jgi:hypothetical protein